MIDRKHCNGCRNDYYNDGNGLDGACWSRKDAVLVLRKKVHIDQVPPWTQKPQKFPDCYTAQRYVMVKP